MLYPVFITSTAFYRLNETTNSLNVKKNGRLVDNLSDNCSPRQDICYNENVYMTTIIR